ncbi:MAG TPA: serine protease, partial [Blastocatellia bacterium]|nr:serine protease [Blastocatellia bacterium]
MTIKLVSLAAALSVLVTCAAARAQEDKQQTTPPRQPAAGVRAAEPKFRLLRSLSGTKGVDQDGRFLIEDPRSAFYIPDDKQVIVYFEWEGPPGPHRFEGLWRNPEGKVVMMSEFSFDAPDRQFAGYFTMLLGANAPTGLWATEARVDGEAAGVHTFQIIAAARPADALPARRILSRAEIYQRAAAASVFIESLKRTGERQNLGSGFFINEGLVLTTFQALDGAALLRVILPDGRRLETKEVLAWNRRQDWAILKVQSGKVAALGRAAPGSWAVGDRCYSLDVPTEGNRVILEGSLIGKHNPTGAGERLNVSFSPGRWALGSPLLNEYGEVIGLIGGSLIPGAAFAEEIGFA